MCLCRHSALRFGQRRLQQRPLSTLPRIPGGVTFSDEPASDAGCWTTWARPRNICHSSAVRGVGARPRRTLCCKAGWQWAQHSYPSEDIVGFMCRRVGLDVGIECGSRSKYTSNMKASDTSWASSYCCRTVSRSPVSPKPPAHGHVAAHVMSCVGGIMIAHDRWSI